MTGHELDELTQYASAHGFAPGVDQQIAQNAREIERVSGVPAEQYIGVIARLGRDDYGKPANLGTALGDAQFTVRAQAANALNVAARYLGARARHAARFARRVLLRE